MKFRRLLTFIALGLTALLVISGWIYSSFAHPVGNGPAGPSISSDAFKQVWTDRRVELVGLGDSVTAGFGARRGYDYFDRLVKNPDDEYLPMAGISLKPVLPLLTVTNLALSGSTSFEVVERELPHLPMADSNVLGIIVITTGGNDLIHNYGHSPPREEAMFGASWEEAQPWVAHYSDRLEAILREIDRHFPGGCQIFIANIFDPTDGVGDIRKAGLPAWPDGTRILAAYNQAITQFSEHHANVHLVDMQGAFLGHGIHCTQFWAKHYDSHDPHYWYYVNLEDPNERGYDVIRRLFLIEMAKIIPNSH